MVEAERPQLSIQRQCQLLGVSRSSYYYQPLPVKEEELILLRLLDEQYLKTPTYGSRRLTVWLQEQGYLVNVSFGNSEFWQRSNFGRIRNAQRRS